MKTFREVIVGLAMDFTRLATTHRASAESHALAALDGDEKEARLAKRFHGISEAYKHAAKMMDATRHALERGDIS